MVDALCSCVNGFILLLVVQMMDMVPSACLTRLGNICPCSHAGFRQEESFLGAKLPSLEGHFLLYGCLAPLFYFLLSAPAHQKQSLRTIHLSKGRPFMSPQLARWQIRIWIRRSLIFFFENKHLVDFKSHLVSILWRCENKYTCFSFSLNGRGCATCRIIVYQKSNGKRGCVNIITLSWY